MRVRFAAGADSRRGVDGTRIPCEHGLPADARGTVSAEIQHATVQQTMQVARATVQHTMQVARATVQHTMQVARATLDTL